MVKIFGEILNLNELTEFNLLGIKVLISCVNSKDIQNVKFQIRMGDVWCITHVNRVYLDDCKWLEIHLSNRIIEHFKQELTNKLRND